MAAGIWVFCRTVSIMEARSVLISLLAPVTPRGHHIEKPFRLSGDHGDPVLGGRCDEEISSTPYCLQTGRNSSFSSKRRSGGSVRRSPSPGRRRKALSAIGEHHIGVGHKTRGIVTSRRKSVPVRRSGPW